MRWDQTTDTFIANHRFPPSCPDNDRLAGATREIFVTVDGLIENEIGRVFSPLELLDFETDRRMKKLLVESSAKLAHWRCLRELLFEKKPEAYYQLLRLVEFTASRNREREAQSCEISAPEREQACASCN